MRTIEVVGPRGLRLDVDVPTTRRERTRGLRGRRVLPPSRAMLFRRCRSVHTLGMRVPIAVAGLDRWFGVQWVRVVPPGRLVRPRRGGARHLLELHPDADVRPGDRLRVVVDPSPGPLRWT